MKRNILSILLLTLSAISVNAQAFYTNGIWYDVTGSQTVSVGDNKATPISQGALTIPSTVEYNSVTYSVTSIASKAFRSNTNLVSIIIPSSVTKIGNFAFDHCTKLYKVTIPNSVSIIEDYAFTHCWALESITIPSSLTSINQYVFSYCTGLSSVTIPGNITSIGDSAFYYCYNLTSAYIEKSVTSIGNGAFGYCSLFNLYVNWQIPLAINSNVFEPVFYSNTTLYIPENSLTDYQAANVWKNFGTIVDPSTIPVPQSVGAGISVNGISYLVINSNPYQVEVTQNTLSGNIVVPSTINYKNISYDVIKIGNSAFMSNADLVSLSIPNSIISIGELSFFACTSLENVSIPNSVKSIGNQAFQFCTKLDTVIVPKSVISFGSQAFSGCENLVSITLSDSITSIKENTFTSCTSLKTISIPNSVVSIGMSAFDNCTALTSIVIPNSVKSIDRWAFARCSSLESIQLSNSLESLPAAVFEECTALKSITIPNSVTSIAEYAFVRCSSLKTVNIANSVKTIASGVFYNCSSLDLLKLPNDLASIEENTFFGCTGLTNITLPNALKTIGSNAFYGCSSLKSLIMPNSLDSIASGVFTQCTSLESVILSNSLKTIVSGLFFGCSALKSINIPSSVKTIETNAFVICTSLESVSIPSSVTSIGDGCFFGCTLLSNVSVDWVKAIAINDNVFPSLPTIITLNVPYGTESIYDTAYVWGDFIVKPILTFTAGGINYKFTSSNTVSVGSNPNASGAVNIPNKIIYKGKEYKVTGVESNAFSGSNVSSVKFTTITLGKARTSIIDSTYLLSIGEKAFLGCVDLTSIDIPASVTSIGDSAFAGCLGLTDLKVDRQEPLSINENVFDGTKTTNITLTVPFDAESVYKEALVWKTFFIINGIYNTFENNEFIMSPNPASNLVKIVLQEDNAKLDILNSKGSILKSISLNEKENVVDLSDLSIGIYLMKVTTSTKFHTQVLVKE